MTHVFINILYTNHIFLSLLSWTMIDPITTQIQWDTGTSVWQQQCDPVTTVLRNHIFYGELFKADLCISYFVAVSQNSKVTSI